MAKIAISALAGISLLLCGGLVAVSHRPVVNRYIRIDEAGRAQAIQYTDLNYSPREGEIRTYLTDWTGYRHTINRETMAKKYPMNYYFLSSALAAQLIGQDNANHLITQVTSGQTEQSEVQVNNVTITSMSQEKIENTILSRGTALETFDLIYPMRTSSKPRTEHWMASFTYYLNPAQVSEQAKTNPQYETINPLGFPRTRAGTGSSRPASPQPWALTPKGFNHAFPVPRPRPHHRFACLCNRSCPGLLRPNQTRAS